jgi:hypothetical protein
VTPRIIAGLAILLTSVLVAALWPDSMTVRYLRAREELQDPTPLEPKQGNGWQSGDRVMLEFEGAGFAGPIVGHVVVRRAVGDTEEPPTIERLVLTRSREGVEGDALDAAHLARYEGLPADHPAAVDVISGATISCVALRDAVNAATLHWVSSNRDEAPALEPEDGGGS